MNRTSVSGLTRAALLFALAGLPLVLVPRAGIAGESAIVSPLRPEVGPMLSPPIGAVPATELWVSLGGLYAQREHGRTMYRYVGAALVVGAEWCPKKFDRLGIGASLVVLQTTSLHVDLPPAIDEWHTWADLGILRLHARLVALELDKGILELALTPFFRLGLPTDTSRLREDRHMPIRTVLDDRVVGSPTPYFLIEPGVTLGIAVGIVSFFTHQAAVLAPVHDEVFHFVWSMHFGLAVRILEMAQIALEASGLLRPTRDHRHEQLSAWCLAPGLRIRKGSVTYEIAARIGLGPDSYYPYGDFTLAFTVSLTPKTKK